jgi:U3 small nucleolar RNA-associated protein 11
MSSLRNAVKRITHKERSQPQKRSHLGILEKRKDYKARAVDFHRKQDRLNAAKIKASMRNPDEFYYGMHNAQVVDGAHRRTVQAKQKEFEEQIGTETIRVMKDQDLSYVRMQKQRDSKKIERLRSSLHYIGAGDTGKEQRKHTIFVESAQDAAEFDVAKHFDTLPELAGRSFNRLRVDSLRKRALEQVSYAAEESDGEEQCQPTIEELAQQAKHVRKVSRKALKARAAAYREIEARTKRIEAMEQAEAHLVTEKLVASKGRKRKIKAAENGQPAVYKWRRKRQK